MRKYHIMKSLKCSFEGYKEQIELSPVSGWWRSR